MGKKKIKLFFDKVFPIALYLLLAVILFWPYFKDGLVSIPGDILIGHYYPWKDQIWDGRTAGYPIKNFGLSDGVLQAVPWRLLAVEQIKNGRLPLWNPYIFAGQPLLANIQVAAFYPFNVLFFIFSSFDAWTIYIFLEPVLASIFGYFFGLSLKISKKASFLLGLCYGFSIMMMTVLENGTNGHTALWLPLSLYAINKIQDSRHKLGKYLIILSVSIFMMILAGYPPPAIYGLIVIFLYSFYKIRPFSFKKLMFILLTTFLTFLLLAPQVLPSFELTKRVSRDETKFGDLSGEPYFVPWENLAMIVAPDYFGNSSTGNFYSNHYHTDTPAIGIVGLVFIVSAFLFLVKKDREVRFWVFVSLLLLMLMLETPLGKLLRETKIPFFSLVTPAKMVRLVSFSFSVLAAFGFDYMISLISNLKKKNNLVKYLIPVVVVWELIFILIIYCFLNFEAPHLYVSLRNLILPTAILLIVSSLFIVLIYFPRTVKIITCIIIALAAFGLLREGIKYNTFIKKELVYPRMEIFDQIRESGSYSRFLVTGPEIFPVNTNIFYHLQTINGYSSIYDNRKGQLASLVNERSSVEVLGGYGRTIFQTAYDSQLADLLGIRFIFSLDEIKSEKLRLFADLGKTKIYENLNVFPRAFLVDNYIVLKNDLDIANRLLEIDLAKEVILEEEPRMKIVSKSGESKATIIKYEEDLVTIKIETDHPSILVLANSYDPGWKATIDGEKTRVLRADFNLRAVEVPEGNHEIIFKYKPDSFFLGLKISLLTQLVLLVLLILNRLKIAPFQNKKSVIY